MSFPSLRSLKPPAPAMGRGGHAGDNKAKGQPGKKGRGRGQMSKRTESEQQHASAVNRARVQQGLSKKSACSIGRSTARAQAHRQAGQVPEPFLNRLCHRLLTGVSSSPRMAKSGHSPLQKRKSRSVGNFHKRPANLELFCPAQGSPRLFPGPQAPEQGHYLY